MKFTVTEVIEADSADEAKRIYLTARRRHVTMQADGQAKYGYDVEGPIAYGTGVEEATN